MQLTFHVNPLYYIIQLLFIKYLADSSEDACQAVRLHEAGLGRVVQREQLTHHWTDFTLLNGLSNKLIKLKTYKI